MRSLLLSNKSIHSPCTMLDLIAKRSCPWRAISLTRFPAAVKARPACSSISFSRAFTRWIVSLSFIRFIDGSHVAVYQVRKSLLEIVRVPAQRLLAFTEARRELGQRERPQLLDADPATDHRAYLDAIGILAAVLPNPAH